MPLPDFNARGDLPEGVHRISLPEAVRRFGAADGQRHICTRRVVHIFELAQRTGYLQRFVLFGSYVTAKPEPNDIDVVLVMDDRFRLEDCAAESRGLFDHAVAQARYGASVFWVRAGMVINESLEEFISYWQIRRDGMKRGVVDVIP